MAANTGKDQPPAYSSRDYQTSRTGDSAETSTTPNLYPTYSTLALNYWQKVKYSSSTKSEYLEFTFSVMVLCRGTFEPVNLALDEKYENLFEDLNNMFAPRRSLTQMKVIWGTGWRVPNATGGSAIKKGNINAMLRLLKSRNGIDYIELS